MAADVFEVKAIGADTSGNQYQCTSHWLSTNLTPAPIAYVEAGAVAAAYDGVMTGFFLGAIGPDTNLHYIYARRVNNGGGNGFLFTTGGSGTFGAANSVAGIGAQLRFITPTARIVGKMFLPGLSDGMFDVDVMQPAYVTVVNNFTAALTAGFPTTRGSYLQVIWTSPKPHATPPVGAAAHDIVAWTHADKPGAQRKRMVPLF